MQSIGIFPAAGGLGGSTYRHLLKLVPNDRATLICRHPDKVEKEYVDAGATVRKATYEDSPQELEAVFKGVDVLFLVSYPSHVHEYRRKVRCDVPFLPNQSAKNVPGTTPSHRRSSSGGRPAHLLQQPGLWW